VFSRNDDDREIRRRAKEAEKVVKDRQKEESRQTKQREAAQARFLESPIGQATVAFDEGAGFFQLEIDAAKVERRMLGAGDVSIRQRKFGAHTDVLSQIESVGWRLEHVSHVYVMTGQISRDKFLSSGQETGVMGHVVGYHLFRRCEENRDHSLGSASTSELAVNSDWMDVDAATAVDEDGS